MTTVDRTPTTPTPAEERLARTGWWLIATLGVLNALDLLITHFVLAAGGVEGNPLMAAAYDHHPLTPVLLKIASVAIAARSFHDTTHRGDHPRPGNATFRADRLPVIYVTVYVGVVAWNTHVLAAL